MLQDKIIFFSLNKMYFHSCYLLVLKTHILLSFSKHELSFISALPRLVNMNPNIYFLKNILLYRKYFSVAPNLFTNSSKPFVSSVKESHCSVINVLVSYFIWKSPSYSLNFHLLI